MNTEITKEQYITFRTAFKALARAKQITSSDIMLYNVIRGLPVSRGFTPITNQVKLANGAIASEALYHAKYQVKWQLVRRLDELNTKYDTFLGILPPISTETKPSELDKLEARCKTAYMIYNIVDK